MSLLGYNLGFFTFSLRHVIDHFEDCLEMFIFGLVVVCSFLIVFCVILKINVWGFWAKGGELSHNNTKRLLCGDFPNSGKVSFLLWKQKKVGFSVRKSSHPMPLAMCYVHGSYLYVAHYPTRLQR